MTIFARNQASLNDARDEIQASAMGTHQKISAVSLDMADASKVREKKGIWRPSRLALPSSAARHGERGLC